MNRDEATLLDIADACSLIDSFTRDLEQDGFIMDLKTQSAVLHQLLILGEAVKRLSLTFREQHPTIPWQQIAGMRDHLIHAYDTVDLDEVWDTVRNDVPQLLAYVQPLLPEQGKNS